MLNKICSSQSLDLDKINNYGPSALSIEREVSVDLLNNI
jgi:hypothetical protein